MPSISCSIGATTRASTSSGVMPGAFMMILTWVEDTSGKASIGRFNKLMAPAPAASKPAVVTAVAVASAKKGVPTKLSYKEQKELEQLPLRIEAMEGEQEALNALVASPEFYKEGAEKIGRAHV